MRTQWADAPLRRYDDWCPNAGNGVKLTRFPVGQPDAAVGCGFAWQVTLVQSVTWREFEKIGHRSADEVRMWRAAVAPAINVRPDDFARGIDVITIEARAMIDVFAGDPEATGRSAISFSTAGNPGGRDSVAPAVKISFLRPQTHGDRGPPGMPIRHIRLDHFSHGAAAI